MQDVPRLPVANDKSNDNAPLLFQAAQVFASGDPGSPQVVTPLTGSHALYHRQTLSET